LAESSSTLAYLAGRHISEMVWLWTDASRTALKATGDWVRTQVPSERRELLVGWIHAIRYAPSLATITLRVPLKPVVNCERGEPAAGARGAGVHRRGAMTSH
jgi:hypothetical protein